MSLVSMTGFGSAEKETVFGTLRIEIRAVNNRFLDIQLRQPRFMSNLEQLIKKEIGSKITRGSLSVFIACDKEDEKGDLTWDKPAVEKYLTIFNEIKKTFKLAGEVSLDNLLKFSDFIKVESTRYSDEDLFKATKPVLHMAIDALQTSREGEAKIIVRDFKKMLKELAALLKQVQKRAPLRVIEYRTELTKRIELLVQGQSLEPQRIASEVAIMADRLDISEEITRLSAHLEKFAADLDVAEPVGKRLNFLLQEMNREANTIGSKANDLEISHIAISMKEIIERTREQIQNIE